MSDDKFKLGLKTIETKSSAIQKIAQVDDSYLSYLNSLPSTIREKVINTVNATKTGIHTIAPLTCAGPENCPFIQKCPIPNRAADGELEYGSAANYPIGKECVLESFFIRQKLIEYMEHLNISPNNPVETSIANELALIDLYKNRALIIMSSGDRSGQGRDFMRVDILGFNENGDVAEQAKIHPAVEVIDKLEKRREKWLDKLMETRKAKAEWMLKIGNTQEESKILSEIKKLREAISTLDIEEDSEEILLDD